MITKKEVGTINYVIKRVLDEQSAFARDSTSMYGRGTASEGYTGGYTAALMDVLLFLHSRVIPNRNGWWDKHTDTRNVKEIV